MQIYALNMNVSSIFLNEEICQRNHCTVTEYFKHFLTMSNPHSEQISRTWSIPPSHVALLFLLLYIYIYIFFFGGGGSCAIAPLFFYTNTYNMSILTLLQPDFTIYLLKVLLIFTMYVFFYVFTAFVFILHVFQFIF